MQAILTIFLLLLGINTEIAKTDIYFLKVLGNF